MRHGANKKPISLLPPLTTPLVRDFRPVVLVTGASSGIGLAIAQLLSKSYEYRLVITARASSLFSLKKEFTESQRLWIRKLDVTSTSQRSDLIREINSAWGGVDILINNAGICYRAVVEHMNENDETHQMSTNYFGPMALIRAVLPSMRKKGRGKIINISSVSGMLAMPTMSSYTASKHALEGASEALWYEMRPLGIDVVLLEPGFIRSDSFKRVYHSQNTSLSLDENEKGPYSDYYKNMVPFIEKLMNWSFITPEKIAKRVLNVIQLRRPPLRIPVTPDAAFFSLLRHIIPRRWLQQVLFFFLPKSRKWGESYTQKRISYLLYLLKTYLPFYGHWISDRKSNDSDKQNLVTFTQKRPRNQQQGS